MAQQTEYPDLTRGIVVDAAHSSVKRKTEYKGIDLSTGEILFYEEIGNHNANVGEFLAVVDAVKYIIENDFEPKVIFSDSTTAISWFNNKRTASGKRNPLLMKAEIYLRAFAYWVEEIKVLKWDNVRYGENPADFGRK